MTKKMIILILVLVSASVLSASDYSKILDSKIIYAVKVDEGRIREFKRMLSQRDPFNNSCSDLDAEVFSFLNLEFLEVAKNDVIYILMNKGYMPTGMNYSDMLLNWINKDMNSLITIKDVEDENKKERYFLIIVDCKLKKSNSNSN